LSEIAGDRFGGAMSQSHDINPEMAKIIGFNVNEAASKKMIDEYVFAPLTPVQVERQLRQISRDLDSSQKEAEIAEKSYTDAKYEFEMRQAQLIEDLRASGEKRTAQEKEAFVTLNSASQLRALYNCESARNINRSWINKLKVQADIVRSVTVSVRESSKL
jgi:hypothetical protein